MSEITLTRLEKVVAPSSEVTSFVEETNFAAKVCVHPFINTLWQRITNSHMRQFRLFQLGVIHRAISWPWIMNYNNNSSAFLILLVMTTYESYFKSRLTCHCIPQWVHSDRLRLVSILRGWTKNTRSTAKQLMDRLNWQRKYIFIIIFLEFLFIESLVHILVNIYFPQLCVISN